MENRTVTVLSQESTLSMGLMIILTSSIFMMPKRIPMWYDLGAGDVRTWEE